MTDRYTPWDRTGTRLDIAALLLHFLVALPGVTIIAGALLVIVLTLAGLNQDSHGFATAFVLWFAMIAVGPTAVLVGLVRRWRTSGAWNALAVLDLALAVAAALLLRDGLTAGRWAPDAVVVVIPLLAACALALVARRAARKGVTAEGLGG
jgi:hypothetical protein